MLLDWVSSSKIFWPGKPFLCFGSMWLFSVVQVWMVVFFKDLFSYCLYLFGLCWVFIAGHWLSLGVVSSTYSSLGYVGFSLWELVLLQSTGSGHLGSTKPPASGLSCSEVWWDLHWPGMELKSPALVGKFLTVRPPREPWMVFLSAKNGLNLEDWI